MEEVIFKIKSVLAVTFGRERGSQGKIKSPMFWYYFGDILVRKNYKIIFCKINFHDEKFILVATELAAESKAKKKFWHYFATGGQSNSV